jgi:RimJ/RimL family protein N-acetyltransferase
MYTVTEFDPSATDIEAWEAYCHFYKDTTGHDQGLPAFKVWVTESLNDKNNRIQLIGQNNALICTVERSSKTMTGGIEVPTVSFVCSLQELPDGFDKIIAQTLINFNSDNPGEICRVKSASPAINQVLQTLNGKLRNTLNFYELKRGDLNQNLVAEWRINNTFNELGLSIELHEYVPEQLYPEFAALMTELMNDIVRDDNSEYFSETAQGVGKKMERFRKNEVAVLTLLLFSWNRELIGISLMLKYPGLTVARQQMTGIKKPHRGKRLAAYLKALLTEETFRRYPGVEKLQTDCYSANKPIIHLNQQLGYRLTGHLWHFEVSLAAVRQFAALHQNS